MSVILADPVLHCPVPILALANPVTFVQSRHIRAGTTNGASILYFAINTRLSQNRIDSGLGFDRHRDTEPFVAGGAGPDFMAAFALSHEFTAMRGQDGTQLPVK